MIVYASRALSILAAGVNPRSWIAFTVGVKATSLEYWRSSVLGTAVATYGLSSRQAQALVRRIQQYLEPSLEMEGSWTGKP